VAKVLVTGSAGGVGLGVCRALLAAGHDVTGFDLRPSEPGVHSVIGDITDRELVRNAIAGNEMVIHLAATPDEADFLGELLEPNVRGLFHICDAARTEQVKRLVLASSVQVVSGHSWRQTIQIEDGPRVVNHYALTKLWLENMGEMYARVFGMVVIAARLGWLPRSPEHAAELLASPSGTDVYLSHDDAGRFFRACVEQKMEPGQFETLFVTSKPAEQTRIDLSRTTKVLGYKPEDTWPTGHAF
tara:strand:+ start:1469 stop:2200 length:732 start_codon:yes stop_codon:yes gene_type:complete